MFDSYRVRICWTYFTDWYRDTLFFKSPVPIEIKTDATMLGWLIESVGRNTKISSRFLFFFIFFGNRGIVSAAQIAQSATATHGASSATLQQLSKFRLAFVCLFVFFWSLLFRFVSCLFLHYLSSPNFCFVFFYVPSPAISSTLLLGPPWNCFFLLKENWVYRVFFYLRERFFYCSVCGRLGFPLLGVARAVLQLTNQNVAGNFPFFFLGFSRKGTFFLLYDTDWDSWRCSVSFSLFFVVVVHSWFHFPYSESKSFLSSCYLVFFYRVWTWGTRRARHSFRTAEWKWTAE